MREFHGRVVDAKTDSAVSGVRVEVYESGSYYFYLERLNEADFDAVQLTSPRHPLLATRTTGADGSFSVRPVHRPVAVVLIATDDAGNGKSAPVEAEPGMPVVLRYEQDRQEMTLKQKLEARRRNKWRLH